MLRSIIEAAAGMFPGEDWAGVEDHVRRAWNSIANMQPWDQVREGARLEWERRVAQRPLAGD
jgi:hypothetical protein